MVGGNIPSYVDANVNTIVTGHACVRENACVENVACGGWTSYTQMAGSPREKGGGRGRSGLLVGERGGGVEMSGGRCKAGKEVKVEYGSGGVGGGVE